MRSVASGGHYQSKFVYFAKTSEPDFAAIDFPAFFRLDLSGSMAAPSIWNFALTTPSPALVQTHMILAGPVLQPTVLHQALAGVLEFSFGMP